MYVAVDAPETRGPFVVDPFSITILSELVSTTAQESLECLGCGRGLGEPSVTRFNAASLKVGKNNVGTDFT